MNENEKIKPWLDEDGNILSDKALRKISKDWPQETWDKYLETLERGIKEKRVSKKKYDKICELQIDSIFASDQSNEENIIQIQKLIRKLTKKQQVAIKLYFYERLTKSQIATRLNISVDSVKDRLTGAVKKLGLLGGNYPTRCPIVWGEDEIPLKIPAFDKEENA